MSTLSRNVAAYLRRLSSWTCARSDVPCTLRRLRSALFAINCTPVVTSARANPATTIHQTADTTLSISIPLYEFAALIFACAFLAGVAVWSLQLASQLLVEWLLRRWP